MEYKILTGTDYQNIAKVLPNQARQFTLLAKLKRQVYNYDELDLKSYPFKCKHKSSTFDKAMEAIQPMSKFEFDDEVYFTELELRIVFCCLMFKF